jgi:hypothetical protein
MSISKGIIIAAFCVILLGTIAVMVLTAHLNTMLAAGGNPGSSGSSVPCYKQNGKIVCQ